METKAAPIDQFFNDVVSTGLIATLTCHTYRVYLAVSPDGQTIVTGAGDETLRSWFSGFDRTASAFSSAHQVSFDSQLKLLQKLLCLLLYMKLKRRELVYMFIVGYMRIVLVNLVSRHCFPVYWNGDNRCVLRGHNHLPNIWRLHIVTRPFSLGCFFTQVPGSRFRNSYYLYRDDDT
ncbi:BnaC03g54900D [Brassica napus]|uniref:BnaC03g54900D protein n=1 Tax=Brassica napus TaxID=3708 RepID=A0A078F6G1_BRANA|nr:BnaC03g54900D [Brassica napus]